ncbi:MAG: hypothetical protein NC191_05895, partial [Muribaculaceae bacterium]|nr:hypothetical protein [Muribaculaceae bacterium]
PANPFKKENGGHPTGNAAPIDSQSKIFTPEEIGRMSQEEFDKNEGVIMEQLRKGQIGSNDRKQNYSDYKNPQSGKERVFTREDLDKMTTGEYTKHEGEIMAQLKSIGIPSKNEVSKNTTTYTDSKSRQTSGNGNNNGHWVTINGNHVFLEK